MSSKKTYPAFDFLETILENELEIKPYKQLTPVKTGDFVSEFALSKDLGRWRQFVKGAETFTPIYHNQLFNKPLVIAFYSQHWKNPGLEQLKVLNNLSQEIRANGGNAGVYKDNLKSA